MVQQHLVTVSEWLLRSSLAGTVLLGIILLVRIIAGGRFRYRVITWLWILLLLRLIWPWNVQTTFSLFNWIPLQGPSNHSVVSRVTDEQIADTEIAASPSDLTLLDSDVVSDRMAVVTSPPIDRYAPVPDAPSLRWMALLNVIWAAGAGLLAVWVVVGHTRLRRIVKREKLVTREAILELLEQCKQQLGLQTVIGIVQTGNIKTPCLFGYLRPCILLPEGILDELSLDELRYVFLHELGHLKRHDILIGWLMAVVQMLHWFNPAVWYAMRLIDKDRELACDELALSRLEASESKAYGATILTFLQRFAQPQKLPAVAGIAENRSLLKRRITMISKFKHEKLSWMPFTAVAVIIVLLGATTFTAAQTDTEPNAESFAQPDQPANAGPLRPQMLAVDDGKSAGRESIAGSGHILWFETDGAVELLGVRLYGSRYGSPQPPDENIYVWIADENQTVLETFEFPYATFKRGNPKWVMLKTEPTKLPEKFYLCVGFNPEQTKGVYVHYDAEASGHSYIGLPHDNYEFKPFDRGDWMIRAVVRPTAEKQASTGSLQGLIDAAPAESTLEIPDGIYEEPITINKSLILKGASRDGCIFKVTADKPAVFIDTAGGKALLKDVTIQWQLASSGQHEYPFAVAVKDTDATISNCIFRPLGNPQRSPVAVRSMGFSEMTITDCDFTGFDYVVCYGEGTKGKMLDSFIRNCGHQGVILYSGAVADVLRNIITGSGYHAVRTTGGKLDMRDNLIINNKNRGVYLGNKSSSGRISNNLLIGNATGIDGVSASRYVVHKNVILNSSYAAIAARPYTRLDVRGNVLMNNPRGVIIQQEESKNDPVQSRFEKNIYWKNKVNDENVPNSDVIETEPQFIEAANGNFKLAEPDGAVGLSDPETIYYLWKKYQEKM